MLLGLFYLIIKIVGDNLKTINKNEEIELLDKYFRLCNYMSVGMLYLKDNVLLKRELTENDIKKKLVGHWGSAPGQNFIYTHLNRVINKYDLNMMYVSGPGHSGQALIANSYIEGTYSELYPEITQDEKGLTNYLKSFHIQEELAVMLHQKFQEVLMKEEN